MGASNNNQAEPSSLKKTTSKKDKLVTEDEVFELLYATENDSDAENIFYKDGRSFF